MAEELIRQEEATAFQELEQARKGARAAYMRFWRSVTTATVKTPPEVLAEYERARHRRGGLCLLLEDHVQCKGNWQRSSLVENIRLAKSKKKKGVMKWLTRLGLRIVPENSGVAFLCRPRSAAIQ